MPAPPGTSARKGIPALAPWKQSSWECQIRYWARAEQWGTQGSPGESACLALGSASCSPPAPSAPSIERRASAPLSQCSPRGVSQGLLLGPASLLSREGGGGRSVGHGDQGRVTNWPLGSIWKQGLTQVTSQGPQGGSEAQNEALGATLVCWGCLLLLLSARQPAALKTSRFFLARQPPPERPPLSSLWAAFRGLPLLPSTWLLSRASWHFSQKQQQQ